MTYFVFNEAKRYDQGRLEDHIAAVKRGTCDADCWSCTDSIFEAVDDARQLGRSVRAVIYCDVSQITHGSIFEPDHD